MLDERTIKYLEKELFFEKNEYGIQVQDIVNDIKNSVKYSDRYASFVIHLNYSCNLKCSYCYQNDIKSDTVMLTDTKNELLKFLEKVKQANNLKKVDITFIGGEPFLELDTLIEIADKAIKIFTGCEICFDVVTNGTLLTEENLLKIKVIPWGNIQVTLDGPSNIHNKYRITKNGKGTYKQILHNLKICQNYKIPVIINCNVSKDNYKYLQGLFNDLKKNELDYPISFSYIFECESTFKSYSSKKDFEKDYWFLAHKLAIDNGFKYKPFYRLPYMVCGCERVNCFNIAPDGEIYKCISGMGNEKFHLTHINEYQSDLYKRKLADFVEYNNLNKSCVHCKFEIICGGWCRYKKYIYGNFCPSVEIENGDMQILRYLQMKENEEISYVYNNEY